MKLVCHLKKPMNELTDIVLNSIKPATIQLLRFIKSGLNEGIETKRIARCALSLLQAGCCTKGTVFTRVAKHVHGCQLEDGGWSDVEESMLSIKLLSKMGPEHSLSIEKGELWLRSQRNADGGWGQSDRDISRIPITGFLFYLLPSFCNKEGSRYLIYEWKKDIQKMTKLTYKGGFFLLGLAASRISTKDYPLIKSTYSLLYDEQNPDGGFGPWKDHAIGSDPWSTGVVLLGLLSYPELIDKVVIERAVSWLVENQLSNGLWPYHYIEEGSAYAYWGLVEGSKFLARESS